MASAPGTGAPEAAKFGAASMKLKRCAASYPRGPGSSRTEKASCPHPRDHCERSQLWRCTKVLDKCMFEDTKPLVKPGRHPRHKEPVLDQIALLALAGVLETGRCVSGAATHSFHRSYTLQGPVAKKLLVALAGRVC